MPGQIAFYYLPRKIHIINSFYLARHPAGWPRIVATKVLDI